MKKPYVKKIAVVSKFAVWLVDGQYVRTKLAEELRKNRDFLSV